MPVKSWTTEHSPNKEPKFHQADILAGIGNSTKLFVSDGYRYLVVPFYMCEKLTLLRRNI
jgi:hypothetical protein